MSFLPDDVACHGICRGGESPREGSKHSEDDSHSIRDGQCHFTVVFDQDIKELPADDTDRVLNDQRRRLDEDEFDRRGINIFLVEQRELLMDLLEVNNDPDYDESGGFGDDRCIRGAIEAKLWHAE